MQKLILYNTLTRSKEEFKPINPPHVGLYVCGPTVYGDAHLGHARPALTLDLLYRYLKHSGYKVRYVRNITDVGHLENDEDSGEDKVGKKARLEQQEPMEIVQYYMNRYHEMMAMLNVLPPGIGPMASGHIIEQQGLVRKIIKAGYAYESGGSVYFDVPCYNNSYPYGKLSGRKIEDLLINTRDLEGQEEKRNPLDFAIWKKAEPGHIMRWPSEWSDGFPGWYLECPAMSTKYLGEVFDIHGGGMDSLFPHHECEIAQSVAASGKEPARFWMHNNLITINGQKMGKSLNNFINLGDFFTGKNPLLDKAYSPMTIRFFMLQAHYRSTLDFSVEALQGAEKGFKRLMEASRTLKKLKPSDKSSMKIESYISPAFNAIDDDLNSPVAIACLFEGVRMINSLKDGTENISEADLAAYKSFFDIMVYSILGLRDEKTEDFNVLSSQLIELIINIRQEAKESKDFKTSDRIRKKLIELGIEIRDRKDGADWEWKS